MAPRAVDDTVARKLHSIAQHILIVVLGLLPLIFLPVVEFSVQYTKTFVVVVATFAALVLYAFATLRTGKFAVSLPLPIVGLWLLVVGAIASALVSGDVRDAFFGDFIEHQTVVFLAAIALLATVVMHVLTDKRTIYRLYVLIAASTIILAVFHILRIYFGPGFLSLGIFGGSQIATPVGSWNDLAIFFGLTILLSIVAVEQLTLSQRGKMMFGGVVLAALIMLAIVNFSPVWFVLGVVSLIVLIYSLARDRMTPKWLEGSMPARQVSLFAIGIAGAVFVMSFIFIAGGSVIGGRISNATGISYVEVRPSVQATTDVIKDVYKTDAIFGVGPNKFVDAWRMHRDASLNNTIFWNTDFLAGVGYIPTFFITMGIIGGLLWVAFLFFFLQAGVRMLLNAVDPDPAWYFIGTSSFVTGLYLWLMSVIYVPGPLLIIIAAATTGLMLTARNAMEPHRERMIVMSGNRRSGFVLVSIVMLVVIIALSGLYTVGQHYASAFIFSSGERALIRGDVASSKQLSLDAAQLMPDDRYYRRIAEIEYTALVETLNLPAETPNLEVRFREALTNSVAAANQAVFLDPTDANNWSIRGAIYSAVVPLRIDGAFDRGKEYLEKARSLDPENPIRTLMLARLSMGNGDIDGARNLMNEAIRQKPDYIDAAFMLSQLEIAAGNIDAAIQSTFRIVQLEPQNPARYFQLGVLELAAGNVERGALAFEAATELDPLYANARYYLAFAYDALGRSADAKAQLERVLETNPDNAEVKGLIDRLGRGEKISEPQAPVASGASEVQTTTENPSEGTVTENPDSPLLTPVNPIPENQDTEEAPRTEEIGEGTGSR